MPLLRANEYEWLYTLLDSEYLDGNFNESMSFDSVYNSISKCQIARTTSKLESWSFFSDTTHKCKRRLE